MGSRVRGGGRHTVAVVEGRGARERRGSGIEGSCSPLGGSSAAGAPGRVRALRGVGGPPRAVGGERAKGRFGAARQGPRRAGVEPEPVAGQPWAPPAGPTVALRPPRALPAGRETARDGTPAGANLWEPGSAEHAGRRGVRTDGFEAGVLCP